MSRKLFFIIAFALLPGLAVNAFAGLLNDPSLVIYYSFDDFDNVVIDQSGKGHDGVVTGDVTPDPDGVRNGAAKFATGSYLDLNGPDFPAEDIPTSGMTLAAWAKCQNTGGDHAIFNARASDSTWVVHPELRGGGNFRWLLRSAGGNTLFDIRAGTVTWDEWLHFAGTYDKATGMATLYINGEMVQEQKVSNPLDIAGDWGQGARVGYNIDNARPFTGLMDMFTLFKRALSPEEILKAMQGEAYPYALSPDPPDGALHPDTWATLSWSPGDFAVSHDVYFSDSLDDVSSGTPDSPAFRGNQFSTFFVVGFPGFPYPDGLVPGTTYYWRIDEVNDAEPNSPWKGDVWSFMIPPRTAYDPNPAEGAEFVDPNAELSWAAGFGSKLHSVYFGDNFDDVNSATGGIPQGTTTYSPGPLELEKVYYWRVDEFDAVTTYKGDVWGFTTPGAAGNPQPANGAAGVQINATLSWAPATTAASHDVYFGTDKNAVRNATTASPEYKGNKALGSESYDPGKLAWHSDYYWRVDALYNAGPMKGLVWSFETADFITVDDFESYNDIDPPDPASNRIFESWIDGFGTTDNGALVGNEMPPYAEQRVVHGGLQSMPYGYDNNLKTSEATLTLVYPRDWTEEGVTKLSLWFRGASGNSAERMFVALNGTAVVYHDNPAATQTGRWTEWVIDLQAFADQGVNLANVNTVTIGIGTKNSPAAGGSGKMYFDDIRLYR
ncbi:MAG: LamG domain-containing protein [Planctomycetota bacterium]